MPEAPQAAPGTVTIELTPNELVLIRVACLIRLDRLVQHADYATSDDLRRSYEQTRELLNTKLWDATRRIHR